MSGSTFLVAPTINPSTTNYAWTETQLAQGYEAQGPAAVITAMDTVTSVRGEGLNRCDDAEAQGLVNAVTYAAAAGTLGAP